MSKEPKMLIERMSMQKKPIKWFFQRLFRGYSDHDMWNLSFFMVKKLSDPIDAFVEYEVEMGRRLPKDFSTDPAAWLEVLRKIQLAFRELSKRDRQHYDNVSDQVKEGLALFGKYFIDMLD